MVKSGRSVEQTAPRCPGGFGIYGKDNYTMMSSVILNAVSNLSPIMAVFSDASATGNENSSNAFLDNLWYILLVVAFGVGLIVINKWGSSIRKRDEELAEQIAEAEAKEQEKGEAGAESETETPAESEEADQESANT